MRSIFFHSRNKEHKTKPIIGTRAALIRRFIRINILLIALFQSLNLIKGLRLMKRIIEKRQSIQGLPGVRKFFREGNRYFFSENLPGWPSSAFNGFIRSELLRLEGDKGKAVPLTTAIIAITSRCRLGCKHCYEWNNIASVDKVSAEALKVIIKKIKDFGVNHLQLSGGEPLERFEVLTELIKTAGKDTDTWILTSGFGLTEEKAFILKKAGLKGADISLDHWLEEEHNRSRNSQRSYYWVKESVRNCKKAGIATCLSLCAFRSFVSYESLIKYATLAREMGVYFIRILEPREAGRFEGEDISLSTEQIRLLEDFYQNINISKEFNDFPAVSYPGYHQRRTGCLGAGNRYLYVNSKGEIHACPFCHLSAGDAVSGSISETIEVLRTNGCKEYQLSPTF